MPEFHPIPIDRRQRLREVRDCLGSAQVPPRRFFALYLGLVTVIDLVSVGVQLLGGDTPLLEDLPSLFAVVLSNLLVQLLLVGTLLYGLAVWRGQRAEYATLGDGFSFAGRCIAVLLLQLLIVGSGLTLMVLPGIYFFYVYRFALFELCEDPGIGPVEAMRREYERRRDYAFGALKAMPGVELEMPHGAFYLFPKVDSYFGTQYQNYQINSSKDLANYLLDEAEIAVVFGEAFYMNGYLRISYANSMENIQEALRRMAEALKKLGRE